MSALTLTGIRETSVSISPKAEDTKQAALAEARDITTVNDEFAMACATDALRNLKQLTKEVEDARKAVKAPVLDLGRTIDGLAKEFLAEVEQESIRVNKLLNAYAAEQRRIQMEAERKRQEEERRQREAAEKAERERLAAEAAARKAEEDRQAAFDEHEESQAKAQAAKATQEAAEAARQAEEARKAQEAARQQIAPSFEKPKGMAIKTVKRFELTDIHALYAARPDLVRMEVNASAINAALRNGMTECSGLIITEETITEVRK